MNEPGTNVGPAVAESDSPLDPQQTEHLFDGFAKMGAAMPLEHRQNMEQMAAVASDPDATRAAWANSAFLSRQFKAPVLDVATNLDAYRENYAQQMKWVDPGAPIDDKAFYTKVAGFYQNRRDETALLAPGVDLAMKAFREGETNFKIPFTQWLADAKGKPGFDPAKLDDYRQFFAEHVRKWEEVGQHYPQVIDTVKNYFSAVKMGGYGSVEPDAVAALLRVQPSDWDAIMGIASRGMTPAKDAEPNALGAQATERIGRGVGKFAGSAIDAVTGAVLRQFGDTGQVLAGKAEDYAKARRKLEEYGFGQIDPQKGDNWLKEGLLQVSEGLPSLLAVAHPAGIGVALAAFSEEARAHFEDAGVPRDKAAALGVLAGVPLTAAQMASSWLVMGKTGAAAFEGWAAKNIAEKTGTELVGGYAKNLLARGAVDLGFLSALNYGQAMTEPAIQAMAHALDEQIPGADLIAESKRWVGAYPESLPALAIMAAMGSGAGEAKNVVFAEHYAKNPPLLRASGFDEPAIKRLGEVGPEEVTQALREEWAKRDAAWNAGQPERLAEFMRAERERAGQPPEEKPISEEEAAPQEDGTKAKLQPDGSFAIVDPAGGPVDQAGSPEMAARAIAGDEAPPPNETDAIPSSTYPLGFTNPAFAKIANAIVSAWGGAKSVWHELRRIPQFTPFRAILNEFNGEQQRRQMRLAGDLEKLVALAPEEKTQEAMFVFVEAGGDRAQLAEWRDAETRPYAKSVYDRALKLTDPQIQAAQWAHDWFDAKFQQGIASGVIPKDRYRVNYVPLNVEGEAPPQGPARGGKFSKEFSHAQERIFANSFELEHARDLATGEPLGLRVESRNLAEVMAQYGAELDRAELTREAMKQLVEKGARASTGEPLAIPVAGSATVKEGEHGVAVNITNPTVGKVDETLYRTVDHPAFKNWYWIGKGAAGENIFKQGYLGLHPEIFQHVENILSRSKIRNWIDSEGGAVAKIAKKAVKGYEITQQFVKQNMLGTLSVFHAKHEAIRAAGNLVAPWELRRVDPDDPVVIEATRLGLQLAGDHEAMQAVEEGLGSSGSLNVVGALSKLRRLKSDEPSAGFGPNKALDYVRLEIPRETSPTRAIPS